MDEVEESVSGSVAVQNLFDHLSSVFSDVRNFKHSQSKTEKTAIVSKTCIYICVIMSVEILCLAIS